ncbi:MAG: molecular chaperone DnaJ [Acidobacteria bacterium]|nr:molecular chaperone DnaJ [Acidobacteriota bacterium]
MPNRSDVSNQKRDYYEVLSVSRLASPEEIKKAYRKIAMQWHPDKNPDNKKESEEKFKEAAEAYSVLSDPQKRSQYDRFGHAAVTGAGVGGFDPAAFSEFSDILGDFFGLGDLFGGGSRRRGRSNRGADIRYSLSISLEEAAFGVKKRIKIPRTDSCPACKGSGAKPGTAPVACRSCRGAGQVRYQQGFLTIARTCPTCGGAGKVLADPCKECRGEGRMPTEKTLSVNIPAGVDTESHLRISGEGEAGMQGGSPGDLYVVIHVQEHPVFERREDHLVCTVPISFAQAALGAQIKVPTLEGDEPLTIPEGTQTGSRFRLKSKGIPHLNGHGRGDLYVFVRVVTPTKLTREQRQLLEQLNLEPGSDGASADKTLSQKVKDLFTG